ncbi:MAG: PKD domain-containing protein [Steroidobacteraceae bacterium]
MNRWFKSCLCVVLASGVPVVCGVAWAGERPFATSHDRSVVLGSIRGMTLSVTVYSDGAYSITAPGIAGAVVRSEVEADVDSRVLRSSAYPQHTMVQSEFRDEFGTGSTLTVTHTGLPDSPDLIFTVRLFRDQSWGEIEVRVLNTAHWAISVQSIRSLHATDAPVISLNGPASADRILSDSYSEDRPQLAIRELGRAPNGMHRAVGSQLIYNRRSGQSLFLGALTSDRLLTIFHLQERTAGADPAILSYEAVATGTTEIMKGESLRDSPPSQQVNLSLRLNPGESLSSERLMFAVGTDYHAQLEQYGRAVGLLHNARVNASTPIGWWSWTAYYFGLNQGTAGTNAYWLAENLKQAGYTYFQIDEGYQYARGEYTTADANLFPLGIGYMADLVRHAGLTFGLWTAPFEVSERSWVFQNHKEWLLHNAAGQLIHIGYVTEKQDPLYVLDTTNPGAQNYLRQTYSTLYNWGVRFLKLDFMDDTAVEGSYYRPNTTALEAQRIGLKIIRSAVGDGVVLDKDGSPMLNPVGIVDAGRVSQDTGHSFDASRDAASGIAARYFMNRNFFIADPDAFTVSTQTVDDQSWHGGQRPLTLDEAKVSIALAAVSGGMFEIGDDLPTLGTSAERLSLVRNSDLIDMARLGRASTPVDLMTYAPTDQQPSVFLLKENERQAILTIFNWTDGELKRALNLTSLGFKGPGQYQITEAFGDQGCCSDSSGIIHLVQKPHSVHVLKLIDNSVPATPPPFEIRSEAGAKSGQTLTFTVAASSPEAPVLSCHWDFGDGSSIDGKEVQHAFTHSGIYQVRATVTGLDATTNRETITVSISGDVSTRFNPSEKLRSE